ncbi:hypothetical protein FB451DRAFT_1171999 [Mycena latifolia]|nr:hypothetical protein FB451DRAFT_1171999 [Mycena latifolia]
MAKWQGEIDTWLGDCSKPNPYTLEKHDGPSKAQVRLDLKRDEEKDLVGGKAAVHGKSATAFLTAGMQIEHAQQRIISELAGLALVAPDRETKIQESRLSILKKVATFRKLQETFMPGAAAVMEADEAARDADTPPVKAERIKLYMPSELPAADRAKACVTGLAEMEAKLRAAVLTVLRGRLHAKRHLITFRNENVMGQISSTKACTLIGQVGDRVNLSAAKYRRGRVGLIALKGAAHAPHFKELKDDDIRLDGDNGESDTAAMRGMGLVRRAMRRAGSGDKEKDLHDSVRVEWARTQARKLRWEEEVLLLEEEMRQTLRYLEWQAAQWDVRQDPRPLATAEVRAGLRGYALKQAALCWRLREHFKSLWETSSVVDVEAVMEAADLEQFFAKAA